MMPHAEFGPNGHREDTPHFSKLYHQLTLFFKDPRQEKTIRMTNLYDTEPYGQDVALEKHKQPSR